MYTIIIHGGAGAISPDRYTPAEIKAFETGLNESLNAGYKILADGGTALDAVSAAVISLENSPLFNAGRGSVLCADGRIQMDAGLMCGKSHSCGAVTLVERIKNPIVAARQVMEKTRHRLLGGRDAEAFAAEQGLELMDPEYFHTELRAKQLTQAQKQGLVLLDHDNDDSNTVGAVALDQFGNIAAATSTGGMTNKLPGRVSDTSIIGAGTFADNNTLAFSATGTGDVFIQNVSAHDAHARIAYKGESLTQACDAVLADVLTRGGEGGVIALNSKGETYLGFNSAGMFRALKSDTGETLIKIF